MKLDNFIFSSPGGRDHNEDRVEMKELKNGAVFVLADGLGGHHFGEIASDCVVNSILSDLSDDEHDMQKWLAASIEAANDKLIEMQQEKKANMKSTVVALCINSDSSVWANVGDSRLYRISNNKIASITEDHSVAYKKYRAGEITRFQIGSDEDQSSLLRVLGGFGRSNPDIDSADLKSGDAFMLCSDGAWEYLHDNEVLFDFLKSNSAKEWAELMLLRIIERIPEGSDNLSMVTVIVK